MLMSHIFHRGYGVIDWSEIEYVKSLVIFHKYNLNLPITYTWESHMDGFCDERIVPLYQPQ